MSSISIRKISIVDLDTDAIVNAANDGLWAGGGVCGAIFRAAGHAKLQEACDRIGHCATGSAVITPGFNLKARYIIHAVSPMWHGGHQDEPKLLYGAYRRSLELAQENGCRSIGFPLISAGIFGYPIGKACRKAIQACNDFIQKNPDCDMTIVFAVLDDNIIKVGRATLDEIAPQLCASSSSGKEMLKIGDRQVEAIYFHKPEEPYGFLSNWYPSDIVVDGKRFSSTEQYIMYRKCMILDDEASAKQVMATDDPEQQQTIGRNAKNYEDRKAIWEGICQVVAMRGLLAKFSQHDDLRQKLLETGDDDLVECARSDHRWACGIGLYDDDRRDINRWKGKNILGFALMEVRERLKHNLL